MKGAPMKVRRIIRTLVLSCLLSGVFSQDGAVTRSIETALAEAESASAMGNYAGAVAILERVKKDFPENPDIRIALGDIFSAKGFYDLAVSEYEMAEKTQPDNTALLYTLSDCYGRLNQELKSISALERLLKINPDDENGLNDLAWMFYKTHRVDEGIALLESAEKRLGINRYFHMTLGTLYSERYDYANAKKYYTSAINGTDSVGLRHFASIAWYNLSLVESMFKYYPEAKTAANRSIEMERRSSGLLARGELNFKRLDFTSVFKDFRDSFSLDETPLSSMDLADLCLQTGRLDEALAYIDDVAALKNHPWMVNFGVDVEMFTQEIHRLYAEVYEGMAGQERLRPKENLWDWILGIFKELRFKFLSMIRSLSYAKVSRSIAASYARQGSRLNADLNFYTAFERYPAVAERYLLSARAFETKVVPRSASQYDLEQGILRKDPRLIEKALNDFDEIWEKDLIAEALVELAKIKSSGVSPAQRRSCLERLYLINRGAFRPHGLGLPVALKIISDDRGKAQALRRALSSSGMELANDKNAEGFAYALEVTLSKNSASYRLVAQAGAAPVRSGKFDSGNPSDLQIPRVAGFVIRSLHEIEE